MLNGIYNGGEVDTERMKRIIGLYRLRMKPQNLLLNLPLARRA